MKRLIPLILTVLLVGAGPTALGAQGIKFGE